MSDELPAKWRIELESRLLQQRLGGTPLSEDAPPLTEQERNERILGDLRQSFRLLSQAISQVERRISNVKWLLPFVLSLGIASVSFFVWKLRGDMRITCAGSVALHTLITSAYLIHTYRQYSTKLKEGLTLRDEVWETLCFHVEAAQALEQER
jgi:hypothetical protein